jgi:hypothetical protein
MTTKSGYYRLQATIDSAATSLSIALTILARCRSCEGIELYSNCYLLLILTHTITAQLLQQICTFDEHHEMKQAEYLERKEKIEAKRKAKQEATAAVLTTTTTVTQQQQQRTLWRLKHQQQHQRGLLCMVCWCALRVSIAPLVTLACSMLAAALQAVAL